MRVPWVALLVQLFTLAATQEISVSKFQNKTDTQPDQKNEEVKDERSLQITPNFAAKKLTEEGRHKFFFFKSVRTLTNTNVVLTTSTVFSSCLAAITTANCLGKRRRKSTALESHINIRYRIILSIVCIFSTLVINLEIFVYLL